MLYLVTVWSVRTSSAGHSVACPAITPATVHVDRPATLVMQQQLLQLLAMQSVLYLTVHLIRGQPCIQSASHTPIPQPGAASSRTVESDPGAYDEYLDQEVHADTAGSRVLTSLVMQDAAALTAAAGHLDILGGRCECKGILSIK